MPRLTHHEARVLNRGRLAVVPLGNAHPRRRCQRLHRWPPASPLLARAATSWCSRAATRDRSRRASRTRTVVAGRPARARRRSAPRSRASTSPTTSPTRWVPASAASPSATCGRPANFGAGRGAGRGLRGSSTSAASGDDAADLSPPPRQPPRDRRRARPRHGVPVTEFRAAVIIGSGSASFEILRHLTERLPIMITPRWVGTRCQPIGIRDVLDYLVGALDHPEVDRDRRDRRSRRPVLRRHDAGLRPACAACAG